uniref:Uncharacterized protein n=1 Tax=Theileria annulata TaxID=5874 RepID=A0A3B0MQ33_THEAN
MKCILIKAFPLNTVYYRVIDKKFINFGIFRLNKYSLKSETQKSKSFEPKNLNLSKKDTDTNTAKISVLLHKPYGYMSTYSKNSQKWSKNLLIKENRSDNDIQTGLEPCKLNKIVPISPLEVKCSGLLIYSQDKSLFNKFSDCEEEFYVVFKDKVTDYKLRFLTGEIFLDGCSVGDVLVKDHSEKSASINFKGSSVKLRKICLLAGLEIKTLKRTRISNIKLGSLSPGEWRLIRPYELT